MRRSMQLHAYKSVIHEIVYAMRYFIRTGLRLEDLCCCVPLAIELVELDPEPPESNDDTRPALSSLFSIEDVFSEDFVPPPGGLRRSPKKGRKLSRWVPSSAAIKMLLSSCLHQIYGTRLST